MSKKKTERRFKTAKREGDPLDQISFPQKGDILVDRFELQQKLGEGAFSVTFRAYDRVNGVDKTLKIFGKYPEVFHSLPDIRAEAKLFTYMDHKSLPKCFGMHETDYIFLEMEYIEAQNLGQKLSKIINKKDKLEYARQLAECLFYLHYRNIEHKDLKPENILIGPKKKLYLIDFGTAAIEKNKHSNTSYSDMQTLSDNTMWENTNTEIEQEGTFEYHPPETRKKAEIPFQRDVFSYGIILYQMYYNKYPFQINSDGSIDYKVPHHLITSKKGIDKIIKNCLQYFAEDRYQGFQGIIDDLENYKEVTKPVHKVVKQYVVKNNPLNKMSDEFKKDLKHLWLSLISLLIILPFFLYAREQESQIERMVDIDAPPSSIFVNGQFVGTPPTRALLKKDDIVSFVGTNDLTFFSMTTNKEKDIKVDVKGNGVYLNHKLKGKILSTDEKIPRSVDFLAIRGDVSAQRLQKLKRKNLHISLAQTAPDALLSYLPGNIKSLSMRSFNRELDLSALSRFRNLESLDLTRVNNVDLERLPPLDKLRVLNLNRVNAHDINPVGRLRALKNLNMDSSNVSDLHPLLDNKNLEILNINNNDRIESLFPLTFHPSIRQIYNNNPDLQYQLDTMGDFLRSQNRESQRKQQIIIQKKDNLQRTINILTIILLSVVLVQVLKLFFRKEAKPEPEIPQEPEPEPEIEPEPIFKKKPPLDPNTLKILDTAVSDKRLYTPEGDNALFYLASTLKEYPEEESLQQRKIEVLELLDEKNKDHLSRNEFEPVFLTTSAIDRYFPDKLNSKLLKKIKKRFSKKEKIKWIFIKEGSFQMGDFQKRTVLPHEVILKGYYISETAVTNQQYVDFLNVEGNKIEGRQTWAKVDTQYSRISFEDGVYFVKEPYGSFPVSEVSWFGAQRFCEWKGGRLPTEAEWEFAARSRGQNHPYATGELITKDVANYLVDPNDSLWHSTFPVKSFPPNKLKLYEMSGNVLEWCLDWYDAKYYSNSPKSNPFGPRTGTLKIVRGGAWCFPKDQALTYYRSATKPASRNNYIGFRVVLPEMIK